MTVKNNALYISYFDEAGDDGFPSYASPLFVLSAVYFQHQDWQLNYKFWWDKKRK